MGRLIHGLECLGVAIVAAGIYAGSCAWFPWAKCWCCGGDGKHHRKDRKVFRDCKWVCKGTGRRLRVGRRIYNYYARVKRKAS